MAILTEEELKAGIAENKKRQQKLSKMLTETYQRYQAQQELDGCLNTLIGAIGLFQEQIDKTHSLYESFIENAEKKVEYAITASQKVNDRYIQRTENIQNLLDSLIDNEQVKRSIDQFVQTARSDLNRVDTLIDEVQISKTIEQFQETASEKFQSLDAILTKNREDISLEYDKLRGIIASRFLWRTSFISAIGGIGAFFYFMFKTIDFLFR